MAENVGYATLSIIPTARGFGAALSGGVNPQMRRSGRAGGEAFSGGVLPAVSKLAAPLAGIFAAGAVGGFFKSAIQGASDLQQNVGGVEAVMKGGSKQFLKWSQDAATSVGIASSEYDRLGTLLGSQLKNGGVPLDQIAGKTKSLISTGADLSAMFGGSAADAVDALSSALKGERDPIERYGVSLNQAKIDAEAAALGFKKTGNSLSTEANQAATLSLIMKQTSDAHGAFARENDTLAHKQQVLNALWTDGKARLGNALLPAVTGLTGVLISGLGPALGIAEKGITGAVKGVGDFVDGFKNGTDAVGSNQSTLAAVGASFYAAVQPIGAAVKDVFGQAVQAFQPFIAPLMSALSGLLPTFASLATAVSPFGIALRGLAPIAPLLASSLGLIATTLATALGSALTAVVPLVVQLAGTISGVLTTAIPLLLPAIGQLVGTFADLIPIVVGVVQAVLPLATTLISQLAPVITSLVTAVLPPAVEIFGALVTAIGPLITTIASALIPIVQALLPVITTVFKALVPIISAAMQIIKGVILVVTGVISGNWSQVWTGIKTILSGVWNAIKAVITGALSIIKAVISAGLGVIKALWSAAWSSVSSFLSGIWSAIHTGVSNGISGVTSFFSGLGGKITGAIGNAGSMLLGIGGNIMRGLLNGITNVGADIGGAVSRVVNNIPAVVKKLLGIHSPSRVMRALGEYTVQGFAKGITGTQSQITTAMQSMTKKITDALNTKVTTKKLVKPAVKATAAVYKEWTDALGVEHRKLIKYGKKGQAAVYKTTTTSLITKGEAKKAKALVKKANSQLLTLAKQRDSIASKLKDATTKYNDALKVKTNFAASVKSDAINGVDAAKATSSASLVDQLKRRVAATVKFRSTLKLLQKAGIDQTTYSQIVAGGVDALPSALALLAGGKGAISQVAGLQKQLATAATGLGADTSTSLYGAGVNAAKGLVDGLASQQSAIEKQMSKLSKGLVKSIKKALGIHSPSRVLRGIGVFTGEGMALGLEDTATRVQRAADASLTPSLPSFRSPDVRPGGAAGVYPNQNGAAPVVVINPRENQSEEAIGNAAVRQLLRAGAR